MTIRRISSGPGLPAGFPFSLGSEEGGTLYISGMPALDSDGKFVPGQVGPSVVPIVRSGWLAGFAGYDCERQG